MFNAPLEDPSLRRVQLTVRLMFAFSGIAFVDLTHLKWENIRDGILQYHRQKSGSLIQLEIPSGALRLLEELSACTAKESLYLFPFLSGRRTGEAAYKEYNRTLSRFNRDLKLLARSTGVTLPVTSYTIRHSFASFLKEQDVSIEVISELLGHKSIKTTQIYLKSFSLERLSKVNRNCFESVCKPIPKWGKRLATWEVAYSSRREYSQKVSRNKVFKGKHFPFWLVGSLISVLHKRHAFLILL